MTQTITIPVTAAQLLAAQEAGPSIQTPSGRVLIPAGRLAFELGSYEGDAAYLASQLNTGHWDGDGCAEQDDFVFDAHQVALGGC